MRPSPNGGAKTILATAAALLAAALSAPAAADDVRGTRAGQKLVETAHVVEVTMDRGHADLVVRRTFHNGGDRHDQAEVWIDLPPGAVATGLRTLGVENGKPRWYEGELLEAEEAAARYRELTGIGGYYPKDPALLSWRSQSMLALQVFPVPPKQPKTVEYTLRLPTVYERGRHRVALPRMGTAERAADVRVVAARPGDGLEVTGRWVAPGASFRLDGTGAELALTPGRAAALEGALASVRLGEDRYLSRVRIHAAPRLSSRPVGAHVVILLDGSRSIGDPEAAVAAARAYLSHLPDARVAVATFDREVRPLHGRFVSARVALADLEQLHVAARNGSRLDDALAFADGLLASAPANAPRRVVVLTDLLTRHELVPASVRATPKSSALVHVGVVGHGEPSLVRDDESEWAAVTRPTGGLVWSAKADPSATASELSRVYEEWVRPLSIDGFAMATTAALPPDSLGFPDRLDEGEGFVDLRFASEHQGRITFEGELWATKVSHALAPDEHEATRWSALVFGSELLHELSEDEMMALARRGRAVSPVTSYLAIEPGVRPSTEGLEWGTGGFGQGFGIGRGRYSTRCGMGIRSSFDPLGYLRKELSAAWARCGGAGPASVELETTLAEVVEVGEVNAPDAETSAARCLSEAGWALDLPSGFRAARASYVVSL